MRIAAVTACPTGIAHSQMAAENLETTAEEMGHEIKVEVQGSMGAENELTAEDIQQADIVIITADTSVQQDRFEGKPVLKKTVKAGVNKAEEVIREAEEIVEGDAEPDADDEGQETQTDTDAVEPPQDARRGGDRSKSLVARLKRLFS